MEPLEFYYYNLGEEPDENAKEVTKKTLDYLKDNGLNNSDIFKLTKSFPSEMELTPDKLPDVLWENSLIKRDTFYYHGELHITSPAPYWDFEKNIVVSPKFFLEMKIKYTINDLINYYHKNFSLDTRLIDTNKEKGAMEFLLNKYKNIGIVEAVDFILYLIDEAVNNEVEHIEILDLKRFEKETLEYLKHKVLNAKAENINNIVWR